MYLDDEVDVDPIERPLVKLGEEEIQDEYIESL